MHILTDQQIQKCQNVYLKAPGQLLPIKQAHNDVGMLNWLKPIEQYPDRFWKRLTCSYASRAGVSNIALAL